MGTRSVSAKSVDTIDKTDILDKVEIELSELFGYNESEQVNVDMRVVGDADKLYITKNNVNVPVFQTYRDDSENIIYYYDFIDSVGFRRNMIEIGMNENSNLIVVTKKTVTICKIR